MESHAQQVPLVPAGVPASCAQVDTAKIANIVQLNAFGSGKFIMLHANAIMPMQFLPFWSSV